MIYVTSTPCRPKRRSSRPKDLIRPHMEPINTSTLNSFEASFSHTSSKSLVAGKKCEFLSQLGKSVKFSCSWERVRSLLPGSRSECEFGFHCCQTLLPSRSCWKGSKIWKANLVWRESLVLVQGEESQRILLKRRIILIGFSPRGGFFPSMCLYLVSLVL